MAYSALSPLSAGIFSKLNTTALKGAYPGTGAGLIGGVKDYVPQSPVYPFAFYELFENDISGLGNGLSVKRVQLRIHIFSQALGMAENQRIMAAAIGLLIFQEPTATGWQIPAIGRPNDVIPIEFSELNGVVVRELVSVWDDIFACEAAA